MHIISVHYLLLPTLLQICLTTARVNRHTRCANEQLENYSPAGRTISLLEYCYAELNIPGNVGCNCLASGTIACPQDGGALAQFRADRCMEKCWCPAERPYVAPTPLTAAQQAEMDYDMEHGMVGPYQSSDDEDEQQPAGGGGGDAGNQNKQLQWPQKNSCQGSCSSFSTCSDSCSCLALTSVFIFWFKGVCKAQAIPTFGALGITHDGLKFRRPIDDASVATTHPPTRTTQNGTVFYPAACNDMYISFACTNTTDGIVHEPIEKWLGG